jgi:hypothetical protein
MADDESPPAEISPRLIDRLRAKVGEQLGTGERAEEVTSNRAPISSGPDRRRTARMTAIPVEDAARTMTAGGLTGPRGRYIPTYPGIKEFQPAGVPPVLGPIQPLNILPKDKRIPGVPHQMERYGDVPVSVNSGRILDRQAGFPIHGLQIDNYSRIWLFVPAAQRFIPPQCIGVQYPIFSAPSKVEIDATAPPNYSQPSAAAGDIVTVIGYEAELPYSAGFLLSTGQLAGSETVSEVPSNATTQETSSTGSAGTATSTTIPAASGKTSYIIGFDVTIGAASAAAVSLVAVTGIANTLNYQVQQETGAGATLTIRYPFPIPASAVNQAITVSVPATTNGGVVGISAYGFQF